MLVHVDSSALAALLLDEPNPVDFTVLPDTVYASDLAAVEVRRVFQRLRLDQKITDVELVGYLDALVEAEQRLTFVAISRRVLLRAGQSFPTHVRTLDAIHLATAVENAASRADESVTFVTHDVRLGLAAQALGFAVVGTEHA